MRDVEDVASLLGDPRVIVEQRATGAVEDDKCKQCAWWHARNESCPECGASAPAKSGAVPHVPPITDERLAEVIATYGPRLRKRGPNAKHKPSVRRDTYLALRELQIWRAK